jgi:hypothetical protein
MVGALWGGSNASAPGGGASAPSGNANSMLNLFRDLPTDS